MLQLIYVSTAVEKDDDLDVTILCDEASRNNARDEITGVLMLEDRNFLQVLEGPKETVENTFLRIVTDQRHHSLLLLSRTMLTRREFGDWSMATCTSSGEKQEVIARVRRKLEGAPTRIRTAFAERFPARGA